MKPMAASLLVLCWCLGHGAGSGLLAQANKPANLQKKPRPKFTIGKDTTFVTEPVDEDGYIDYASALNRIMSKGVTPANNANVLLWQAFGPHPEGTTMSPEFYRWLGIPAPPEKGDYFLDLFGYLKKQGQYDPAKDQEKVLAEHDRVGERPWQTGQYPRVAHWLRAQEKPLALVVQASKRPQYFSPIVVQKTKHGPGGMFSALLPGVQKCRELAHALIARAMLHLGENRPDEAWQDLLAAHRLGRQVARGGTLIEGLVGIAIDNIASEVEVVYLASANLNAKQAKARLADLQRLPPMPPLAEKINYGERFMVLDSLMLVDRYGDEPFFQYLLAGKLEKQPIPFTGHLDWDPALRKINNWFDKMFVAYNVKDPTARIKKVKEFEGELMQLAAKTLPLNSLQKFFMSPKARVNRIGDEMVRFLLPGSQKQDAWDRAEQTQHNLHLAFALAAYKSEQGQYPKTLDALAPKYLPQIPQDIFSGKALVYRPSANGYLLYSVGINGQDDRGHWRDDDPPGDDLRVQMPLPEPKRKQ